MSMRRACMSSAFVILRSTLPENGFGKLGMMVPLFRCAAAVRPTVRSAKRSGEQAIRRAAVVSLTLKDMVLRISAKVSKNNLPY